MASARFLDRRLKLTVNEDAGGPPGGAGLPGLQLHSRIGGQAAYRAAGARPAQGAGPGTDALHEERQPHPPRCGAVPLPRRVAGILRLLRDPLGTAPHRPMGQTAAPRHRLAAKRGRTRFAALRRLGVGKDLALKPPGVPAARGGSATAPRSPTHCPTPSSPGLASPLLRTMPQRRTAVVRTRMPGGVGGAEP